MSTSPWRVPALALVPVLALTACGDSDREATPATTVEVTTSTQAPATKTTATAAPAIDVTAVPAHIDEAYVEAVMATFDRTLQEAIAAAAAEGTASEAFQGRVRAVYTGAQAEKFIADTDQLGQPRLANPPGLPTTDVLELRTATTSCVSFTAARDLLPLVTEPYDVVPPYYVQLVPDDPKPFNPTPWVMALDSFYRDGSDPGDPCT